VLQRPIEVILTRQLASYLAIPIFIVDPAGTLVFYNEPAEGILGKRYEETGEMPAAEWSGIFAPTDEHDVPLAPERLPLRVCLAEHRPAHGRFLIRGLDGVRRHVEATAFPLIGHAGRDLGAVAVFWESSEPCA
jgi:PAS domain-containing protein